MSTSRGPGQAWWESHLNAIAREGMGFKAYAQREGLNESSLYYWRRRIRAQTQDPQPSAHGNSALNGRPSGHFVPVMLNANRDSTNAHHVLILGSGLRLELASRPTPQWLAQVSQAMAAQVR